MSHKEGLHLMLGFVARRGGGLAMGARAGQLAGVSRSAAVTEEGAGKDAEIQRHFERSGAQATEAEGPKDRLFSECKAWGSLACKTCQTGHVV